MKDKTEGIRELQNKIVYPYKYFKYINSFLVLSMIITLLIFILKEVYRGYGIEYQVICSYLLIGIGLIIYSFKVIFIKGKEIEE